MIPISVIIPVYNSEKYIKNCVESLKAQTFSQWEAIFVNDGSRDKSGEILDAYAANDSRVCVIHTPNGGVSAARNIGISNAHGTRVMFLDSDDALEPDTLKCLYELTLEHDYDVICWSLRTSTEPYPQFFSMSDEKTVALETDEKTLYELRLRAFSGWSLDNKKDASMHLVVTKLIKKSLIKENNICFDTTLKYHEDTLFCIEVMQCAKSAIAINRYFYIRTIHSESASVSFCNTILDGNKKCLNLFGQYINAYHKGDSRFEVAYMKYQLAWFMQILKLDYMNPNAAYTQKKRIKKIGDLMVEKCFCPQITFQTKGLKKSHIVLWLMVKMKWKRAVYCAVKFHLV